jgi:DMSO reductase anchor subunit
MALQSQFDNASSPEERQSALRGMVLFLAVMIAGAVALFFALGQPSVRD